MVELWKVNMTDVWHRPPRHVLKEMRQREHEERAAARAKLTTQQKLDALDRLLGEGVGAKKERAKLQARLAEEKAAKAATETVKKAKAEKAKAKTPKKSKNS